VKSNDSGPITVGAFPGPSGHRGAELNALTGLGRTHHAQRQYESLRRLSCLRSTVWALRPDIAHGKGHDKSDIAESIFLGCTG